MLLNFDQHAEKGNEFLLHLAFELGYKNDKVAAARILRSVFKTLRNYLTLEENFQFVAQMPVALKGVYIDDWSPIEHIAEKSIQLHHIYANNYNEDHHTSWSEYPNEKEFVTAVRAVLKVMVNSAPKGEFNQMYANLPGELQKLVDTNRKKQYSPARKNSVQNVAK